MRSFIPMKKTVFCCLIAALVTTSINSQEFSDWTAYTSYRFIKSSANDSEGRTWISTDGGLAIIAEGEVERRLTTIDGLTKLDGINIHYDENVDRIFVGYLNGTIDVIEPSEISIETLTDITRNSTFTSKTINKMISVGESLFVGTDFGIVQYNLENYFVENTYLKLGDFDTGTSVADLFISDGMIYAATQQGIAITELDGDIKDSDWNNFDGSNGFVSEEVQAIGVFENVIYASTSSQNYIYENNIWNTFDGFSGSLINDYEIQSGDLIALADKNLYRKNSDGSFSPSFIPGTVSTTLTSNVKSGDYKFGTFTRGLVSSDQISLSNTYITPSGPYLNVFDGLAFDDNVLVASSTQKASEIFVIENGKGFYTFDGSEWKNYNIYTNDELRDKVYRLAFVSEVTEDFYYFGSWGRGIARLNKETEEIKVFDETNSTLRGYPADSEAFPVMIGLQDDSNGDIWSVSRYGGTPLYRQTPGDDDWQSFEENSAISSSDLYEGLFIDSFNQKWIPLQNSQASGTGLLIIDTGDSENADDDTGIKLQSGANSGNLPDNEVNAIIQDLNGEVWIGTSRGIAKFIFPELIVEGSSQEKAAQWLINEDTSAVSRFLLRDVNASAMAVNAANEKWIGSENQGVWLLNAEGSRILKRFTSENSPLFSNTIKSIAVNEQTGEVFFATDVGLISYQDVPRSPVAEMDELKVYPNPFRYGANQRILIEGLSESTTIKILGVDGTVVNRFESTGGRVEWNGRDSNNNELGTGVYFVVAVDEQGDSKGVGKVVIVK